MYEHEEAAGVIETTDRQYRPIQTFTVLPEHLVLLRAAYVGWSRVEFGAPEIDPKRPYGNSNVLADIAEMLEVAPALRDSYGDSELSPEQEAELVRLHYGTAIALQIALQLGVFAPGTYRRVDYGGKWEWVEEPTS